MTDDDLDLDDLDEDDVTDARAQKVLARAGQMKALKDAQEEIDRLKAQLGQATISGAARGYEQALRDKAESDAAFEKAAAEPRAKNPEAFQSAGGGSAVPLSRLSANELYQAYKNGEISAAQMGQLIRDGRMAPSAPLGTPIREGSYPERDGRRWR